MSVRVKTTTLAAMVLLASLCGRRFVLAAGMEWSTGIFDCSTLDGCEIKGDAFKVVPDGGPDDAPAVVFDDVAKNSGSFEIDLSAHKARFSESPENSEAALSRIRARIARTGADPLSWQSQLASHLFTRDAPFRLLA